MIDKARLILKPEWVYLPFVVLGLCCWLLPAPLLGLYRKSELSLLNILVVGIWYTGIIIACLFARKLSASLVIRENLRSSYNPVFYLIVTALSAIGTAAVISRLGSFDQVVNLISDSQVNALKEKLYSDYGAGIITLRYACVIGSTIALYRILILKRLGAADIVNLLCLLICAFVSARLLIFQAALIFLYVILNTLPRSRLRWRVGRGTTIIIAVLAAAVLVAFTYVRSAGTYRAELGITNPVAVTGVELSRYAAMPIQVSLGVANLITNSEIVENRPVRPIYLAPTFFQPDDIESDNSGGIREQWYLGRIDLPVTLSTNSALAACVGYLGLWAFLLVPLICAFYAFVFHALNTAKSLELKIFQGIVLYAFFELWRLYFFSSGAFIYLNLVMLSYCCAMIAAGRMTISLRRARKFVRRPRSVPLLQQGRPIQNRRRR